MDSRNMVIDVEGAIFKYLEFNGSSRGIADFSTCISGCSFSGDVVLNLRGYDNIYLNGQFNRSNLYVNIKEPDNGGLDRVGGYSGYPYSLTLYDCEGTIGNLSIKYSRNSSKKGIGMNLRLSHNGKLNIGNIYIEKEGEIEDIRGEGSEYGSTLDLRDLEMLDIVFD